MTLIELGEKKNSFGLQMYFFLPGVQKGMSIYQIGLDNEPAIKAKLKA
jgi:hypothetical protein